MASEKQEGNLSPQIDLGNSIDELDSLIVEGSLASGITPSRQPEIPVLNDIVDATEVERYTQGKTINETTNIPADKDEDLQIVNLNKLMETVDQKLASELDPLIDILKDTIKDSIMNELKQQLKKEVTQTQSSPPDINNPDKSFK